MATTRPRITITLTERQHVLLRALSKYSGQSMSAFVTEFLSSAEPTLEGMAAIFQKVHAATEAQRARIKDQLAEAHEAFAPLAMASLDQADMFLASAFRGLDDRGRNPRSGSEEVPPTGRRSPPTNRGDTIPRAKQPKAAPSKARSSISPIAKIKKASQKKGGKKS